MTGILTPLSSAKIDAFVIHDAMRGPGRGKLDPITVFLRDQHGAGSITVTCFGAAWNHYFGATGTGTLRQFIAGCDEYYLATKLQGCSRQMSKKAMHLEEAYLQDIARAIIEVLNGGAA